MLPDDAGSNHENHGAARDTGRATETRNARAHEQGDDACVATVFCDDNKKYLSTDLCSDEECKEHYRVNEVELLDFQVIPPVPGIA